MSQPAFGCRPTLRSHKTQSSYSSFQPKNTKIDVKKLKRRIKSENGQQKYFDQLSDSGSTGMIAYRLSLLFQFHKAR